MGSHSVWVYVCMLCLLRYLFIISTSVIDCLGRFIPKMTYCVSSGTLNLAQLNSTLIFIYCVIEFQCEDSLSLCVGVAAQMIDRLSFSSTNAYG